MHKYHRMFAEAVGVVFVVVVAPRALADPLTIYEIQSTTSDGDASVYNGQVIDCAGGIVTGKFEGFRYRIMLQDPAHPDAWGGIQVKDWTNNDLYNNVELGDWVQLTSVLVEEFRGTTMLQWQTPYTPGYVVISQGSSIPAPVPLTPAQLPYPVNHAVSERYESMVATISTVTVGQMDLGKADDNYELIQGGDIAWATDYMNVDAGGPYDPRIASGVALSGITGLVEQYTDEGTWDYYQLVTRSADDIVVESAIPTASGWGIVVMLLVTLTVGSVGFRRIRASLGCMERS